MLVAILGPAVEEPPCPGKLECGNGFTNPARMTCWPTCKEAGNAVPLPSPKIVMTVPGVLAPGPDSSEPMPEPQVARRIGTTGPGAAGVPVTTVVGETCTAAPAG